MTKQKTIEVRKWNGEAVLGFCCVIFILLLALSTIFWAQGGLPVIVFSENFILLIIVVGYYATDKEGKNELRSVYKVKAVCKEGDC